MRQREADEIRAAKAQFNKLKRFNVGVVTRNNERFEPGKLTRSMLQHHNKVMTETLKRDVTSESPGPFITKLRRRPHDAESTPELNINKRPTNNKTNSRRPNSSSHAATSKSLAGGGDEAAPLPGNPVPTATDTSRESSRGRSGGSRLLSRGLSGGSRLLSRELGGGSTDLDVETGVLPLLSENPAYRDWETNETSLRYLEEKVMTS